MILSARLVFKNFSDTVHSTHSPPPPYDFLFMLLDTDIAHKATLFLHEQLFGVLQCLLLLLLNADIAHKDTLFFHEQLFYVLQDVFLMLLDADIAHKDNFFLDE